MSLLGPTRCTLSSTIGHHRGDRSSTSGIQPSRNEQGSAPLTPSGQVHQPQVIQRNLVSMSTTLSFRTSFLFLRALIVSCSSMCSSYMVDTRTSTCVSLSVQSASSFLVSSTAVRIPSSRVSVLTLASLLALCSVLCAPKSVSFTCVCVFSLLLLNFPRFGFQTEGCLHFSGTVIFYIRIYPGL